MNWRQIIKALLTDVKELGLCVEIELVLGDKSQEVAAIRIKTQAKLA